MPQFEDSQSQFVDPEADEKDFGDLSIVCIDCDGEFVWSGGEQLFFKDKGLKNPPKRCKPCKKAKNERIEAIHNSENRGARRRIEVAVDCAECGAGTTVPFYPSQGRPVYCRSCFIAQNPEILNKENE